MSLIDRLRPGSNDSTSPRDLDGSEDPDHENVVGERGPSRSSASPRRCNPELPIGLPQG